MKTITYKSQWAFVVWPIIVLLNFFRMRGHSFFSSPQQWPMTSDFEGLSIPDFIHYIFPHLNSSSERASIFPFECSVLNKGTTGTILITSLVWRGPWLRIEPGTSGTRSQHYTTRLSRRRWFGQWNVFFGFTYRFYKSLKIYIFNAMLLSVPWDCKYMDIALSSLGYMLLVDMISPNQHMSSPNFNYSQY